MAENQNNNDFQSWGSVFKDRKKLVGPKPPAYPWQDLALQIIKELNIPNAKRSSIFKVCRDNSKEFIEMSLNDTKELCQSGEKWKYFLKIIDNKGKPRKD
jgi:hypothetical protein